MYIFQFHILGPGWHSQTSPDGSFFLNGGAAVSYNGQFWIPQSFKAKTPGTCSEAEFFRGL